MWPIVPAHARHAFQLKSFFVGVVVMVGKVETLPIIQIVCRRPPQIQVPIKIFLCGRSRNGQESRIKFNSSDHSDRVSQTAPDNVLRVSICR